MVTRLEHLREIDELNLLNNFGKAHLKRLEELEEEANK